MDFLLFEPQLSRNGSHYLNYTLDICRAAQKQGLRTKVFAASRVEPNVRQIIEKSGIELLPVFPSARLARIRVRALIWPLTAFVYAWILVRYVRKMPGNHIICTFSGTLEYLSGISLAILLGLFRSEIIVQMYFWENREHLSVTPTLIRLYRQLTEWLVKKAIDRGYLLLAAQGKEMAAHISKHLNRPIRPLPFAIDWSNYIKSEAPSSPLKIGFLGAMRAEKGFRQFVEAVENISDNLSIIVQVQMPKAHGEPNARELLDRLQKNHPCRVLEGELSISKYRKLLTDVDIAVLPYSPKNFSKRTSNLFSESVGLGKPVVAPRATLMGELLEIMNIGIAYSPYTSSALCKAISAAVSNYDELASRARSKADRWCKENSADSFINNILKL